MPTKPVDTISLDKRSDAQRVTLRHRVEYGLVRTLFGFSRLIGVDAASFIGHHVMRHLGPFVRKTTKRGEENLSLIHPDWSPAKRRSLLKDVWGNLGRIGAEFAHLSAFSPTWDHTDFLLRADALFQNASIAKEEYHYLKTLQPAKKGRVQLEVSDDFICLVAKKKSAIFLTGHFSNWEIMSVICGYANIPCVLLYRKSNNPLIDQLIIDTRRKTSNHRQIPKGPEGMRAFLDAVRDEYSLAILMDQHFTDGLEGVFMGEQARTPSAPARMHLNFNLPILPISILRTNGAHFKVTIHDELKYEPMGNVQKDIEALTVSMNSHLENFIDQHPDEWLWFHRRWGKDVAARLAKRK